MQILAFSAKRGKIRACSFWFCHCFCWENLSQKVSETALTSYFPVIPYGNPCQGHIVNHQIKTKEAQGWACGQFLNFTLGTNLRFTFVSPQIPWSTLPTKLTYHFRGFFSQSQYCARRRRTIPTQNAQPFNSGPRMGWDILETRLESPPSAWHNCNFMLLMHNIAHRLWASLQISV